VNRGGSGPLQRKAEQAVVVCERMNVLASIMLDRPSMSLLEIKSGENSLADNVCPELFQGRFTGILAVAGRGMFVLIN